MRDFRVSNCGVDNRGLSSGGWYGGHHGWKHSSRGCYSRAGLHTKEYKYVVTQSASGSVLTLILHPTHLDGLVNYVLHWGRAGACARSSGWPQDRFGAGHGSCCDGPCRVYNKTIKTALQQVPNVSGTHIFFSKDKASHTLAYWFHQNIPTSRQMRCKCLRRDGGGTNLAPNDVNVSWHKVM